MLKYFGGVWLILTLLTSCATLNQNEIKQTSHELIEKQQLNPIIDYYGERIDLIRNKMEMRGGANDGGTEDMPYHDAGFYLGNGLFYDLNGNLSLLPWHAFYNIQDNFTILKKDKLGILNNELRYLKTDSTVTIITENGIGFTKNYEIKASDSLIVFTKGKLMKMEFQKKTNGSYFYKRTLSNEDIQKIKRGYVIKKLLNKDYYTINENEISLANQVVVAYRNNMIEIFEQGWSKPQLKYQMLVNNDAIIIYDKKYRGYKIVKNANKLSVYKNRKIQEVYEKVD